MLDPVFFLEQNASPTRCFSHSSSPSLLMWSPWDSFLPLVWKPSCWESSKKAAGLSKVIFPPAFQLLCVKRVTCLFKVTAVCDLADVLFCWGRRATEFEELWEYLHCHRAESLLCTNNISPALSATTSMPIFYLPQAHVRTGCQLSYQMVPSQSITEIWHSIMQEWPNHNSWATCGTLTYNVRLLEIFWLSSF